MANFKINSASFYIFVSSKNNTTTKQSYKSRTNSKTIKKNEKIFPLKRTPLFRQ